MSSLTRMTFGLTSVNCRNVGAVIGSYLVHRRSITPSIYDTVCLYRMTADASAAWSRSNMQLRVYSHALPIAHFLSDSFE